MGHCKQSLPATGLQRREVGGKPSQSVGAHALVDAVAQRFDVLTGRQHGSLSCLLAKNAVGAFEAPIP